MEISAACWLLFKHIFFAPAAYKTANSCSFNSSLSLLCSLKTENYRRLPLGGADYKLTRRTIKENGEGISSLWDLWRVATATRCAKA